MKVVLLIILAALLNSTAQASIKMASKSNIFSTRFTFETLATLITNPYVLISIILYFGSFLLSFKIFEMAKLNVVVPVYTGCVFVFVGILSFCIFHESISLSNIIGFIMIISGIFFMVNNIK